MGVFPQSRLPVVVEIAPGADLSLGPEHWPWVDVTDRWLLAESGTITIGEGRTAWGQTVDAGTIGLTFLNDSGDLSEFNPLGQWYGLLGADTPLRVRLRRAEDTFTRTVTGGWGTADSGQAWTVLGTASNYAVAAGVATHSHGATNQLRRSLLDVNLVDLEQLVDVSPSVALTGAGLTAGVIARYVDTDNYYWIRIEFDADGTDVIATVSRVTGGVVTDLDSTTVPGLAYAAGTPVRTRASVIGRELAIKVWAAADPEPAGWTLSVVDDDADAISIPGPAGWQTRLGSGNSNSLPVLARLTGYQLHVDLAGGYVPAWVPRWDQSGNVRTVPVVARGTLYRLKPGTAKPPKKSPMRRDISASPGLVAYWPGEDGGAAGQAASAISGHTPIAITGPVTTGVVQDLVTPGWTVRYGTQALLDLSGGGMLTAEVPPDVTAATAQAWTLQVGADLADFGLASGDIVLSEVETPGGTYVRWRLVLVKATFHTQIIAVTAAGATTTVIDQSGVIGSFNTEDWSVWQSAPGTITVGWSYTKFFGAHAATATIAGTLTGVTRILINPTRRTVGVPFLVGHIALWALTADPLAGGEQDEYGVGYAPGYGSWEKEAAHLRLARHAAEDGIRIDMPPVTDPLAVVRMGWQPVVDALTLYQQAVDADGGVLYERPFRLGYQPRQARESQTPALVLDAQDDLAEPPDPDHTGQAYRNRWTVNRVDGSSAIAQADEVAAGAIVHEDSADLILYNDDDLAHHAGWRLHLTSGRELTWPKLVIDLAARPDLIDQWLNCRVGSRILAGNPMADVAGTDIDVLIEGAGTVLGYKTFDVAVNCSPARPWDIAVADGEQRAPADGSTLAADLAAGAMTLSLASTTANGPWSTDPTDYPLDVRVGGERITISTPAGGSSPQTVPITARGVNGVTRAWPAGTRVDVWSSAIAPL